MSSEQLFEVDKSIARPVEPMKLSEAGFREREHLQEWIVANPSVLGAGVKVVTIEFDRWQANDGSSNHDRLDVLGIGTDGRLVVAELKRDRAPDTVEMQAIKYAAMASRFDLDSLAKAHAAFLRSRGEDVTEEEAIEALETHAEYSIDAEKLRTPRIVLVAAGFPASVTATVVWLTEMGLDISLVEFQAYRTDDRMFLSVSTIYPVKEVEDFTVAPTRGSRKRSGGVEYPTVEWTEDDYVRLADLVSNPTVLAVLTLCSAAPNEPISFREVEEEAGRSTSEARADLGGLTMMVKARFSRANWPLEAARADGDKQKYYSMTSQQAEMWIAAVGDPAPLEADDPPRDH